MRKANLDQVYYYIQVQLGKEWRSIARVKSRMFADVVAAMADEYWPGARMARAISESMLKKEEGVEAVRKASDGLLTMTAQDAERAQLIIDRASNALSDSLTAVSSARERSAQAQRRLRDSILYAERVGHTEASIANAAGISRQRVNQILKEENGEPVQ